MSRLPVFAAHLRNPPTQAAPAQGDDSQPPPVLQRDASKLAEHHLSSWFGETPLTPEGTVDEAKANKFDSPILQRYPLMRVLNPQEEIKGQVIRNDSLMSRDSLAGGSLNGFKRAGATAKVWFDCQGAAELSAGIVTCGGLCPGLNSIIREVTRCLWHGYGVRRILGFPFGYNGFDATEFKPIELTNRVVRDIHMAGGSILQAGRGGFRPDRILDTLAEQDISLLFVVGGDGTQWAADVLYQVAQQRSYPVAIIGIPKSIDNDVLYFDRTFGFDSAVMKSVEVIKGAWTEAVSCLYGVSIVKLMGRDAGFVVSNACTASTIVDCCLTPEVSWNLPDLLAHVDETLAAQGHMVIVVAEGAGQEVVGQSGVKDATGHTVYTDIGPFLKAKIGEHLSKKGKGRCFYIDPSYIIRSVPATPNDHIYCTRMAYDAVHAGMRGYSGVCVGSVHNFMVMVPMDLIASGVRTVSLGSSIWQVSVAATQQPASLSGLLSGDGEKSSSKMKVRGNPGMFRRSTSKL